MRTPPPHTGWRGVLGERVEAVVGAMLDIRAGWVWLTSYTGHLCRGNQGSDIFWKTVEEERGGLLSAGAGHNAVPVLRPLPCYIIPVQPGL